MFIESMNLKILKWLKFKTWTIASAGEDLEQNEHSLTAGGNVKWYSDLVSQFDSFLQN